MIALLVGLIPAGSIVAVDLRCEALTSPLGVDSVMPQLSWKLKAIDPLERGLKQTGYQVVVASSESAIRNGKGDVWDSGWIRSGDNYGVTYKGSPLKSGQTYFWRVKTWDQLGRGGSWSDPTSWTTGLFKNSDWKAKWIGLDTVSSKLAGPDFDGAQWIWTASDPRPNPPKGMRRFTRKLGLPAGLKNADVWAAGDDHIKLYMDGKLLGESPTWERPIHVVFDQVPTAGEHTFEAVVENSVPSPAGFIFKFKADTSAGGRAILISDTKWQSAKEVSTTWEPSRSVGAYGVTPWGQLSSRERSLPAPRMLRKMFELGKPIKRALVHASALGLFELHVNGKVVSDELFMPGWTDYDKRVYYRTYDVTKMLREGPNAMGAVLADGWYAGYVGYGARREHYGAKTRFLGQLEVEYTDGSRETVATGPDWKGASGGLIEADFLMGETYDARKEPAGWSTSPFPAVGWRNVDVTESIAAKVEAFPGVPVRAYEEVHAKSISETAPGVYTINLGQNMAGFARLKVTGKAGQKVTLRFAERLNPDNTIYTTNLRGARAIDTYICKGKGEEIWQPRFTFHGFQYIEVTGLDHKPTNGEVVGIAISSETPRTGMIETSDPMLNRLIKNAWWTQKMNFIDIPTDCPQRDERLGWTGDAQAYIRTAAMNDDVQAFFNKWLVSLDDGQRADGQFPTVAPVKVSGPDGGPAWADAGVICPWTIYDVYGDRVLLAQHYPQMKKFVDFCKNRSTAELLPPKNFHCFGDWLNINSPTPNEVIYEAYFAGSARIVANAAKALGFRAEAATYMKLYEDVKTAFKKAYVSEAGVVKGDSQCAYVLALAFDLVDGPMAEKAADRLVKDIEKRGWHLSTGFVGTRDIMHVLSKIGRNDVAFRLLHNTTFPSWGFTIVNGATSIWERWDGWTPEKGFQDPGMNSFAHYAFGAVVGWVYAQVGGIQNLKPGFEEVLIAPQLDPKLTWARASYNSVRGKILVDWRVQDGRVMLSVEVPPNCTAQIAVPNSNPDSVTASDGATPMTNGRFRVGSGQYTFRADYRR